MFAGVYHWFPKMYGRFMNNTLGYVHFFMTFVGAYVIFLANALRRSCSRYPHRIDYSSWESFKQFGDLNKIISIAVILVFFAQLIFVVNYFVSIWKGRKVTNSNPWEANSLEWTTPIHPGHGNWDGPIPTVYRWAYDYKDNGEGGDHVMQHIPLKPKKRIRLGIRPMRQQNILIKQDMLIMQKLKDYQQLMKLNLSMLVVFSSVTGYIIIPELTITIPNLLYLF